MNEFITWLSINNEWVFFLGIGTILIGILFPALSFPFIFYRMRSNKSYPKWLLYVSLIIFIAFPTTGLIITNFAVTQDNRIFANDFTVINGKMEEVEPEKFRCETALATDPDGWTLGHFEYNKLVSDHFELTVSMQPSTNAQTLEIAGAGVILGVIIGNNRFFFWDSKSNVPLYDGSIELNSGSNELKLWQDGKFVKGYLNGTIVGDLTLNNEVPKKNNKVGIFFKGRSNTKAIIFFHDFVLMDLQ